LVRPFTNLTSGVATSYSMISANYNSNRRQQHRKNVKTGLCECNPEANYCSYEQPNRDESKSLRCTRTNHKPNNGTCICSASMCINHLGVCTHLRSSLQRDSDGFCECKNTPTVCLLQRTGTVKRGDNTRCHEDRYKRTYERDDTDGHCKCKDTRNSCRLESTGLCTRTSSYYEMGYHGICVLRSQFFCIKRWVLGVDGQYNGDFINYRDGRNNGKYMLGSDSRSCACNKEAGYCFSKDTNECERFEWSSLQGSLRHSNTGTSAVGVPGSLDIFYKNAMQKVWFGSGDKNFCNAETHPFTGEGCRTWRKEHKCDKMLGLAAVKAPAPENCMELAKAEKRCYTSRGGGKIVLLPSHMRVNHVIMCFCSTNACVDEAAPHAAYHTFACGQGAPGNGKGNGKGKGEGETKKDNEKSFLLEG